MAMKRREFLTAGAATAGTAATLRGGTLAWLLETAHLSPLAAAAITPFGGFSPPDLARVHSGDRVSVHIPYEEDDADALDDWVDADDDRDLLSHNEAINTATVIVPRSDLIQRLGTPDLADVAWLDGDVDLAQQVSIPEPIELRDDDVWSPTTARERWLAFGLDIASDGVAFDDIDEGALRDAREATGADDDLVDDARADIADLTVAVVDTGFNTAGGSLLGETTLLDASWNVIDDETVADEGDDAVEDGNGHGTHVASTIVADPGDGTTEDLTGYLPGADLLVVRALDDDGSGSTEAISRAITHAADEGADLLCLSLGSPLWSVELERALSYAAGADVLAFTAAGNDRFGTRWVNTPSDTEYSMAVGAGEIADPEEARTAYFSNVGPDPGTVNDSGGETAGQTVTFAAPGMGLTALTADTSGSTEETTLSGTSMACPCVVGCAGLLLAETGVEQDLDAVEERLADYAAPVPKMGVYEAGAGYPDVAAAIDEDEPDDDQEDARDREAEARDDGYETLSDLYGGAFTRRFL